MPHTDHAARQVELIRRLFEEAEAIGMPIWLESGWAIDARLGRITRDHDDIDIAFPEPRRSEFVALIGSAGFGALKHMDYGFQAQRDDLLLDCEPCSEVGGEHEFRDFPSGSCPAAKEGLIDGFPVRCISWEAMYWEFLGYLQEVPQTRWREKDHCSFAIIGERVGNERAASLRQLWGRDVGA